MNSLQIGKITKPQGLKGECKVLPSIDDEKVFKSLKEVCIDGKTFAVLNCDYRFGFAYITLEGINDITLAEKLRNKKIYISKEEYKLEEDEYFIDDIIGFRLEDENANQIGTLIDVEQYGAADIFVVLENGREYRIAFLKEIFTKVDQAEKVIHTIKSKYDEAKICD